MRSPDYRFRILEMIRDGLECLQCDTGGLTIDQRRRLTEAYHIITGVRFEEYPPSKKSTLEIVP